ncbi:MAG: ATP-binding protein, partial [Chloroflexota bacterium]
GFIGISVSHNEPNFTANKIKLAETIAGQIAGAVENARLFVNAQEAQQAAEAANQAKSLFLANMSHELRTPLNAILGFTQVMQQDQQATPEQLDNLKIINASGSHLLALINDVLEMSKIEAGRIELNEYTFNLHQMLDNLHDMFRLRGEEKGITLTCDYSNVPSYIYADEGKLRQVLINLLGNAIKFTEKGYINISVSLNKANTQTNSLHFEVMDSGSGIDKEELETLFEPFTQSRLKPIAQEGTGLGLAITQQFIDLMEGQINVDSTIGEGTSFSFDIPCKLAPAEEIGQMTQNKVAIGLAPNQDNYRILVAEDKFENRKLLVEFLTQLGFSVQEAANGQEAIDIWQVWHPHLIWMDMRMPVMDGYTATKSIKTGNQTAPPPIIIALTANAFTEDKAQFLSLGCDDFLRKPIRLEQIVEKMTHHLDVKFLYEDDDSVNQIEKRRSANPPELTPNQVATIPATLQTDLRNATLMGNFEKLLQIVGQIRSYDHSLADQLTELVNSFEFDKILTLLSEEEQIDESAT